LDGGKKSCQFNDSAILKGDSENNFINDDRFFFYIYYLSIFFMSNEFFLFLYMCTNFRGPASNQVFPELNVNDYIEEVYGNIAGQGGQIVNTIDQLLAINLKKSR
jgi:hypothetical protein